MICNNCKSKIDDEARFCTKCGADLSKTKPVSEEGSVDRYFSERRSSLIEDAKRLADSEMKQGLIWFGIACAITLGGYLLASDGGTYYVFWGAMIYGGYRLIRGIGYKLNPESLLEKAEEESEKEK